MGPRHHDATITFRDRQQARSGDASAGCYAEPTLNKSQADDCVTRELFASLLLQLERRTGVCLNLTITQKLAPTGTGLETPSNSKEPTDE